MTNFRFFIFGAALIFSAAVKADLKEVALTIDDAPREDENIFSGRERTQKMIEVLKRRHVQTVFFCNSSKLGQANGQARIQSYADAGQFIANHTHTHPSLNKVSTEDYIKDIDQADRLLSPFPTFKKWFRYPFLDEGETPKARDQVRSHLKQLGYLNGYVTADNYDYLVNDLVQRGIAAKKKVDLDKACEMLIDLSLEGLEYQEGLAKQHLGKPVRQVLLMHENDLEVICMDRMIDRLQAQHWKIISPVLAFAEPALLREPDSLFLKQGRIAAVINARTGEKHKFRWESTSALEKEFARRKIVK